MLKQLFTAEELVGKTITNTFIFEPRWEDNSYLVIKFMNEFVVYKSEDKWGGGSEVDIYENKFTVEPINCSIEDKNTFIKLGIISEKEYNQKENHKIQKEKTESQDREIEQLKLLQLKYPNL